MTALANYTDLVAAIQSFFMDRSDLAAPAADYFIALGEGIINYRLDPDVSPLRVRDMETIATITLTSGTGPLPSDYLQYRRVATTGSPRRELEYITPQAAEQQYPSRAGGLGNAFTIIGSNLYTFPLVSTSCELTYYAAIPALVSGSPTNWLMTKNPAIYLRASLFQAADWIKNDGEIAKQRNLLAGLVNAMNRTDQLANSAKAPLTFRRRVA